VDVSFRRSVQLAMAHHATRPRSASHEDMLALALTLLAAAAVVLLHVLTYAVHAGW
jgi:hypothetical protein